MNEDFNRNSNNENLIINTDKIPLKVKSAINNLSALIQEPDLSKETNRYSSKFQKYINNAPITENGFLNDVYRLRSGHIPEHFPLQYSWVSESDKAEALNDDMDLRNGLRHFFDFIDKKRPEPMYLIIEAGLPHLPGLFESLLTKGIDPAFVIQESPHDRFRQTLKYWSTHVQMAKNKSVESRGYATLIDVHRKSNISRNLFLTPDRAKELGIKQVVLLTESQVGEYFPPDNLNEPIIKMMEEFDSSGLEIVYFGIDSRYGFRKTE